MTKPTQEKSPQPLLPLPPSHITLYCIVLFVLYFFYCIFRLELSHCQRPISLFWFLSSSSSCHFLPTNFSLRYFFTVLFVSSESYSCYCWGKWFILWQKPWTNPGVISPPLFIECWPFHGFTPQQLGIQHFRRGVIAMEIGGNFSSLSHYHCW